MKGFQDFIMRGNLIELAVAFIVGAAFATLVTAFTNVVLELVTRAGGAPSFDDWKPFGMDTIGPFLTALVAFVLLAAVVYFLVVTPYEAAKRRFVHQDEADAAPNEDVVLLTQIRDLLAAGAGPNTTTRSTEAP